MDQKTPPLSIEIKDAAHDRGRSPLLLDHDYGLGISGLRRIRQHPATSRGPTAPSSPTRAFTVPSRTSSMLFDGSSSPILSLPSEDLTRLPSESPHSYSFVPQNADSCSRQTVLKRAVEFMRDHLGWQASQADVMSARAKLSGDVEIQGMVDLLVQANLLGRSDSKSTRTRSFSHRSPVEDRISLRRSQTDLSLVQSRLVEALVTSPADVSPIQNHPENNHPDDRPIKRERISNKPAHTSIQGIFTTNCTSPWSVSAANDVACLIFGVSMCEIRKLSVLDLIPSETRLWLLGKLSPSSRTVSTSAMGSGLTASLLSKPSWRARKAAPPFNTHGVLLCGDVLEIKKHNGAQAWASFWVKEKRGGLIWVLEEVELRQAVLQLDEDAQVSAVSGQSSAIFGDWTPQSVLNFVPHLPLIDGFAVDKRDLEVSEDAKHFVVPRTDGTMVPVRVEMNPASRRLTVSSLPYISGVIVISATDHSIIGANSAFSSNLLGYESLAGQHISHIIPDFDRILTPLDSDEDDLPQSSRAMQGRHRDGSALSLSVHLRVANDIDVLWISHVVPEFDPPQHPSLSQKIEEAASEPLASNLVRPSHESPRIDHSRNSSRTSIKKSKKHISDYAILEDMGEGAYGQVKLARDVKGSGLKVVIKYVLKRRILVDTWTRDRRLGTVPLEIHVLDYLRRDDLNHPNIVEMTDFFEDDVNYYIEMVPHGLPGMDLFDYIEMRSSMDESECQSIFGQVVAAIYHLHIKALVVHRDIKDENIILDGEGNVKLIDFGSAAYIKNGPFDVFVGTIGGWYWVRNTKEADYAAPEVLQGKAYSGKEQDIWALGILLYTLVYKENPFYSIDEILDHELRIPFVMSASNIDIIGAMLNRDVSSRLDIAQVAQHEWCRLEH